MSTGTASNGLIATWRHLSDGRVEIHLGGPGEPSQFIDIVRLSADGRFQTRWGPPDEPGQLITHSPSPPGAPAHWRESVRDHGERRPPLARAICSASQTSAPKPASISDAGSGSVTTSSAARVDGTLLSSQPKTLLASWSSWAVVQALSVKVLSDLKLAHERLDQGTMVHGGRDARTMSFAGRILGTGALAVQLRASGALTYQPAVETHARH